MQVNLPADWTQIIQVMAISSIKIHGGIVIGNPATISLDGNTYKSSLQLQMAHELLHPLQRIKDLAEVGPMNRDTSEKAVQDQEQDIAKQLGYRIGIDFPDVQAADHGYEVVPSRS